MKRVIPALFRIFILHVSPLREPFKMKKKLLDNLLYQRIGIYSIVLTLDPTRRVNLFVGTKLTERPVRNHRAYRNRASPLPINTHSRSPHFLMNRKVNAIDTKRGRSRALYFV